MRPPIRVLYTIPNLLTAGGGQVLIDLFSHLDRSLVAPMVCVSVGGVEATERLAGLDVPVIEAPFTVQPRPLMSLLARSRVAASGLSGVQADVWHSWHYIDDYTEPIIARLAGTSRWVFTKKSMAWQDRAWKVRTALATGIVATNTDMVEAYFGSPWLRRRTQLIPIGVDHARFATASPLDLRVQAGLPRGVSVVSSVARIHRGKSIEVAIGAMAHVPDTHLVVAGRVDDEGYRTELEALAVRLGVADRVHLVGAVGDVAGLLAASDVFVLPSGRSAEGCPVALLEAMASGLACVATDTPGSRDVVADRRTGLIVPVGDERAMGGAISALLADAEWRRDLGRAGEHRVERDYSIDRSARAHEHFYRRLMGRRLIAAHVGHRR